MGACYGHNSLNIRSIKSEKEIYSTKTVSTNIFTYMSLQKLILGYLRPYYHRHPGLLQLTGIIIQHCRLLIQSDYYQILINEKSYLEKKWPVPRSLAEFNNLPKDSKYRINTHQCPNCGMDRNNILNHQGNYSWRTGHEVSETELKKENRVFVNYSMEYQCQNCEKYVVCNMRKRIIREDGRMFSAYSVQHEVSVFGDRTNISPISVGKKNEYRECVECDGTMDILERTKMLDTLNVKDHRIERDLCKKCDLVSTYVTKYELV